MKNIYWILMAFTIAAPALAQDSGFEGNCPMIADQQMSKDSIPQNVQGPQTQTSTAGSANDQQKPHK